MILTIFLIKLITMQISQQGYNSLNMAFVIHFTSLQNCNEYLQ